MYSNIVVKNNQQIIINYNIISYSKPIIIIIVAIMCSDNETHGGCTFLHLTTNIKNINF